jgi:hypothetical protein
VRAAVDELVKRKPHLAARRPTGNVGQADGRAAGGDSLRCSDAAPDKYLLGKNSAVLGKVREPGSAAFTTRAGGSRPCADRLIDLSG